MDSETRKEIRSRTVKLEAYEKHKETLNALEIKLNKIYRKTHIVRDGVRSKITKRQKIALANRAIDRALGDGLSVDKDAINQMKILAG